MTTDENTHPMAQWFSNLLFQDVRKKGKVTQFGFYLIRLITHLVRGFNEDLCPQRAAALAYTSVLSLVPVTALFVLYFKVAGKLDAFSVKAQSWIFEKFVAESALSVTVYINQFVDNLNTKTLGTLGAVGLVVSAYLVFRSIERSLNDIWKVRKHRSLIERFKILCTVLISVPAFLVASIYLSGKFQELKFLGHVETLTVFMRAAFVMTPFLLTALPFFMIFKFVPNTSVQWRSALISALISSVLFEFAKSGFNFYVLHIINVGKVYGALGLIPVLLIWIYFSWIIILLGVELAFTIQNYTRLQEEAARKRLVGPLDIPLHEEWGLRVAVALARRFSKGEGPVSRDVLAEDVGLKPEHVEDHLLALQRAKLVVFSEQEEEEPGYLFSRPIESIEQLEIINLFRLELGLSHTSLKDSQTLLELIKR